MRELKSRRKAVEQERFSRLVNMLVELNILTFFPSHDSTSRSLFLQRTAPNVSHTRRVLIALGLLDFPSRSLALFLSCVLSRHFCSRLFPILCFFKKTKKKKKKTSDIYVYVCVCTSSLDFLSLSVVLFFLLLSGSFPI